jgi:hypothetical protein
MSIKYLIYKLQKNGDKGILASIILILLYLTSNIC